MLGTDRLLASEAQNVNRFRKGYGGPPALPLGCEWLGRGHGDGAADAAIAIGG